MSHSSESHGTYDMNFPETPTSTDSKPEEATRTCQACIWWVRGYRVPAQKRGEGWVFEHPNKEPVQSGDCRKNPPIGPYVYQGFPKTHETDWCGGFAAISARGE